MFANIEQISSQDILRMSLVEFDSMPFGMIRLDRHGTIKAYNAWEGRLAQRNPKDVIGRNFFLDIAPCTNVESFRGKLDELAAAGEKSHIFDYSFAFPWGARKVRIRFVIESQDERWVLVTNVGQP